MTELTVEVWDHERVELEGKLTKQVEKLRTDANVAYGRLDRAVTRHVRVLEQQVAQMAQVISTLQLELSNLQAQCRTQILHG